MGNNGSASSSDGKGDRKDRAPRGPPPLRSKVDVVYIKHAAEYRVWVSVKEKERSSGFFSALIAKDKEHCKMMPPSSSSPSSVILCKEEKQLDNGGGSGGNGGGPEKIVSVTVPPNIAPGGTFMAKLANGKQMRVKVPTGATAGTVLKVAYRDSNGSGGERTGVGCKIFEGDTIWFEMLKGTETLYLTANPSDKKGDQRLVWEGKRENASVFRLSVAAEGEIVPMTRVVTDGDQVHFRLASDPRFMILSRDNYVTLAQGHGPPAFFTVHLASNLQQQRRGQNSQGAAQGSANTNAGQQGGGGPAAAGGGLLGSLAGGMVTALAAQAQREHERQGTPESAMMAAAAAAMAPSMARAVNSRYSSNPMQMFDDLKAISMTVRGATDMATRTAAQNPEVAQGAATILMGAMMAASGRQMAQDASNNSNRNRNSYYNSQQSSSRGSGRRGRGLDSTAIQRFPTSVVRAGGKVENCVICMDDMRPGDTCRRLTCFHAYHVDCIDDWLQRSASCPICKRDPTSG